jgi:hypothetical protein
MKQYFGELVSTLKSIEKLFLCFSFKKKREKQNHLKSEHVRGKLGKILWENSTFVSYVNINQQDYNLALFAFCLFSMAKIEFKAQNRERKGGDD